MIQIAGERFRSKADAERRIRDIFSRHALSSLTEAVSGADLEFVHGLLTLHTHRDLIANSGIAEIRVQRVPFCEGHKRFLVIRKDSSWRDFSWRQCLTPRSQLREVASICRHIIVPQILRFRDAFWANAEEPPCPILGILLTRRNSHVDHFNPSFAELVAGWLRADGLSGDDIEITHDSGYQQRHSFTDPGNAESWADYHQINANLRMVSARANLSTLRRDE